MFIRVIYSQVSIEEDERKNFCELMLRDVFVSIVIDEDTRASGLRDG